MNEYIEVGQPLQFTDPNTPTRVGEIVENVSDIYNIPSPRLGMQVFVKSEKNSFVITSLKSKVIGGVDVPEAAVEAFEPVSAKSFTWNNDTDPSNMNDFVVAGVYDIKGERTRIYDNLPILNTGGGHTFNARLTVLDSSITGSGKDDDKCITQVLSFSNRLGQGEVYIRTGKGASLDNLTWEKWSTLQRNVNVGEVQTLDNLIDNGIYSGVLTTTGEMFALVVINNYAVAGNAKSVSQFKYSIPFGGSFAKYETRVGGGNPVSFHYGWEILNKNEIDSMIKSSIDNAIKGVIADAPEAFDTLKEIADWIANDKTGAAAMLLNIQQNTAKIDAEVNRAQAKEKELSGAILANYQDIVNNEEKVTQADNKIKAQAAHINTLHFTANADNVTLSGKAVDGNAVLGESIPVATTENAGVMTAEDKGRLEKLVTIDYADNSYTAGKWVEENGRIVAASSSSYAKYSPIPVCGGQKIVYSAASGSNNIPLYITDKDGVAIYSTSRMNGEIYAPSEAAFIYITSTIARYSCVVYGVYDTYSYRAQKLDKLLGEDIALPLNGYYTATGAWQASDGWYCTNKIAVSENSGVETNATYIACWDINGKWLGRNSGKDGMLEGTKYIAVYSQNINITLRFNSDYCNIPTQEDMHSLSRSIESLAGGIKGIVDIDAEMSDSIALANNNVTVIEGVAGEAGARYSVPIAVKGNYGITIKFRMPDDLHTSVYERELASFGTRASSSTNGFSVEIKSVLPTNDLSQISCKSTLGFYPTNSKTNNYAGSLSVGSTNRPFVGEAAFSIRYTGSLEGNEDIAYTLGENALRIYHTTTDVDVLNVPYPEDGLTTSLLDALNVYAETIEVIGYSAENITLDSIIKCSAIPLVGTYGGTTDAFPSFVLLKDDSWHTLEVRFDASKEKGLDMIAGYIDGYRFYHVSNGYKLYGDGYFKSELTFGCEGVVVKSIKVEPVLKSEIPNIVALCQHGINGDEKFNSTVTSSTNLSVTYGRTEEILRTFKKYGFKYVTSKQIEGYLKRGEELPHNCFTIIHDDYHYLRENAEKEYARDIRKLYLRNGIKAAFGIIPIDGYLSEETAAECIKDKDVFEFLIHDDYSLSSSKGYQAIAARIANNISNFKSKLYTSNIWVYTGGVFDANIKMMLHAAGISMAYYTSGTTTSGGISPMKDMMVLPRLYMNDTSPNTISILEDILSNLVKH